MLMVVNVLTILVDVQTLMQITMIQLQLRTMELVYIMAVLQVL